MLTRKRQSTATRLIHTESDDERKPSLSPDSPDPASQPTMVVAQSLPIFGPDRPLPPHITDLLTEYHRENGPNPPHFAYKGRPSLYSKVFDRQGKEMALSLFPILEPRQYNVLVLHGAGAQDRLVSCHLPYASKHGTYLVAWLGIEEGYDEKCCAVRIFNRDLNAIRFSDEAWKALEDIGRKSKDSPAPSPATTRSAPRSRKRLAETPRSRASVVSVVSVDAITRSANEGATGKGGTSKSTGIANVTPTATATANTTVNTNNNAKTNTTDANADSSEYETDSGSEESSEEPDEVPASQPPAKKAKTAPERSAALSKSSGVVFKLVSYKSGALRCFPLEECKSGKELFQKARDFFRLFDRNVDVRILSCQMLSRPEQHYLFEGSEGEFGLLVEQVQGENSGRCTVEVGHILSC